MENEYFLDTKRINTIHVPQISFIAYYKLNNEGSTIKIDSSLDVRKTGDREEVIITSTCYFGRDYVNETTISLDKFQEALIECVESEKEMNIFSHRYLVEKKHEIVNAIVNQIKVDEPESLIFHNKSTNLFFSGLGLIKQHDKLTGVFESFQLDIDGYDREFIFIDSVSTIEDSEYDMDQALDCEYYDINNNVKISFYIDRDSGSDEFIYQSVEPIAITDPMLERIKEAIKTPVVKKGDDIISDQVYSEYRNARLSVISEFKKAERKKAITSKFSNIDLF